MYDTAILITGFPASGKTTALEVCEQMDELACFEMSDFVREDFKKSIREEVDDNELGRWASRLKEDCGEGIFAERLIENWIEPFVPTELSVAVSGIRSPDEVIAFEESNLFNRIVILGVVADEEVRWERCQDRDGMDRATFEERIEREERWGTGTLLDTASVRLMNNFTTQERFELKVKETVELLLEEDDLIISY